MSSSVAFGFMVFFMLTARCSPVNGQNQSVRSPCHILGCENRIKTWVNLCCVNVRSGVPYCCNPVGRYFNVRGTDIDDVLPGMGSLVALGALIIFVVYFMKVVACWAAEIAYAKLLKRLGAKGDSSYCEKSELIV